MNMSTIIFETTKTWRPLILDLKPLRDLLFPFYTHLWNNISIETRLAGSLDKYKTFFHNNSEMKKANIFIVMVKEALPFIMLACELVAVN